MFITKSDCLQLLIVLIEFVLTVAKELSCLLYRSINKHMHVVHCVFLCDVLATHCEGGET